MLARRCIPGLHDRAPLRRLVVRAFDASKLRIPGLHDRAPLRRQDQGVEHAGAEVFPVFMTGLH